MKCSLPSLLGWILAVVVALSTRAARAQDPVPTGEAVGIARITSVPQGATVTIDGTVIGEAPVTRYLTVGQHMIRLTLDHFDPFVRRIDVAADTTLEVRAELAPGGGTVEFVVEPAGAKVVLNDNEEWPTPVRLNRAPGHYSYRLEAEGYETAQGEFEFQEGQNLYIARELRSADGLVTVTSDPPGARVRAGEQVLGTTPLTLDTLPKGPHLFLLDVPGHALMPAAVDTTGGGAGRVDAYLPKTGIPVSVATNVAGARVLIEGVTVGTGELVTFRAAERVPYHVEVRTQGMAPGLTTLVIEGDKEVRLKADWRGDGDGQVSAIKHVRPLTKKWTFWTAAGAGAAILGAGAVVALSADDPDAVPPGDARVTLP